MELVIQDTLMGRKRVEYEPYKEDQQRDLRDQLVEYLEGEQDSLQINSYNQMKEIILQFKNIYQHMIHQNINKSQVNESQLKQ